MKNYKTYLSVAMLLLSGLASSCSYLDIDDSSLADKNLSFKNPVYVERMCWNVYSYVRNSFTEVGGTSTLANACDEADQNNRYSEVQAFNNGTWGVYSNPDDVFAYYYAAVRAANHFLENTENIDYKEFETDDPARYTYYTTRLKQFRTEVRALRAYFYFELIKRYGGVPIITRTYEVSENVDLVRDDYMTCVDFIASELDAVAADAPLTATDDMTGRVTKGMVYALKCRVYLYAASPLNNEGDYNKELCIKAAEAFSALYNLGLYDTSNTYSDLFLVQTSANKEIIFDRRTKNDNWLEHNNYPLGGLSQYAYNVGEYATCPSQNLVDAYELRNGKQFDWNNPTNAAAPYANRDPRLAMTILCNGDTWNGTKVQSYQGGTDGIGMNNTTTTGYYLRKGVVEKLNLRDDVTGAHVHHIFRYGEMLLEFAEAMNEAYGPDAKIDGCPLSARDAVNTVRSRTGVDMPGFTETDKKAFRERLRNERRVELAFEGHRFWDVRRWMIAEETENAALRGMQITVGSDGTLTYNPQYIVEKRVFRAPAMYRYPIQYEEIIKYKKLEQTEGWN